MSFSKAHMFAIGLVAIILSVTLYGFVNKNEGFQFTRVGGGHEGFEDSNDTPVCNRCNRRRTSCGCPKVTPAPIAPCPRTMEPDLSKYILK